MKRFIKTNFFRTLREASQKGIQTDAVALEQTYEEFALLLFSLCATPSDRVACHNTLVYTRVELVSLTGVSGEKCRVCSESC